MGNLGAVALINADLSRVMFVVNVRISILFYQQLTARE